MDRHDIVEKHGTQFSLYDSNVQAYRSNSLASQSLLLAVGAFLYEKEYIILFVVFVIAMFQLWYIWFRVINARIIIADFHKFNYLYDLSFYVNKNGECEENPKEPLTEEQYLKKDVRRKANSIIAKESGNDKLKHTYRLTRIKLDILLPASFSVLWLIIIVSRTIQYFNLF